MASTFSLDFETKWFVLLNGSNSQKSKYFRFLDVMTFFPLKLTYLLKLQYDPKNLAENKFNRERQWRKKSHYSIVALQSQNHFKMMPEVVIFNLCDDYIGFFFLHSLNSTSYFFFLFHIVVYFAHLQSQNQVKCEMTSECGKAWERIDKLHNFIFFESRERVGV